MKQTFFTFLLALISSIAVWAQPVSNPIVIENHRITLITPTLFRLEYSETGNFVDAPTLFAYNKKGNLLKEFQWKDLGNNRYEITTSALRLEFENDGFPFGLHNFAAYYVMDGKEKKFTIRGRQSKNLGGAISTLDRVKLAIPLDEGLLSRDGWYIINDYGKDILVQDWLAPRDKHHVQDLYCFVYGNDYKAALASLGAVSGNVPMTRKYVHGVWYCRWWDYTSDEYMQIVKEYKENNFPLDNLVFDMGWHTQDAKVGTGHAGLRGWTGYTWNTKLLPDPEKLVGDLAQENISVSLNDHPHDGIRPHEEMYNAFMTDMKQDPRSGKTLLFDAGNREYMEKFFKHAHGRSDSMGVAFWWLDWQQNYLYPEVRNSRTGHLAWLNKLYYDKSAAKGKRGAGYSRWGGWGDHRYPIQFSGDAYANWDMLAFEVELTCTSGNAGCYYWAHDIGGFYEGTDPELYARWTQFGALSAALRTHSFNDPKLDRRPWLWGEQAKNSMFVAYKLRSQLMPYIYSKVWETHCTMVPLNRAMYIDYGKDERAYTHPQQFLFGDLLLAAPIASAGKGENKTAGQKVWFPGTDIWYDYFTGESHPGGTEAFVEKDINTFPLFVKGGYLLPLQPYTQRPASTPLECLILRSYPGVDGADNTFTLYEDDGITSDYENGAYATTQLRYTRKGNAVTAYISPAKGKYTGQVKKRSYRLELPALSKPDGVKINGKKAKVGYDEPTQTYVIETVQIPITQSVTITYTM